MQTLLGVISAAVAIVIGLGVFALLVFTYFAGIYIERLNAWIYDRHEGEEFGGRLDGSPAFAGYCGQSPTASAA